MRQSQWISLERIGRFCNNLPDFAREMGAKMIADSHVRAISPPCGHAYSASMNTRHIAVWLDHKEARTFAFQPDSADELTVLGPPHNDHHKWTRGQEGIKEHPEDLKRFFHDRVQALQGVESLLVVGPGSAKLEFLRYVHTHDLTLEAAIVGIETVDHPTDGQIVAFARKYFKRVDPEGEGFAP